MSAPYRILDANLNRLREGLRVIEEHARFDRNDSVNTELFKSLRHLIREIIESIGQTHLLAARDTPNDIGREISTASEFSRTNQDDVLAAAFSRCQEATRVVEEYSKIVAPEAARTAEKVRYQLYVLEPAIMILTPRQDRLRKARLYVLITEALCRGGWLETAKSALVGGAGTLQLREKDLPDRELLHRARVLRELTREHNALLIINDRPDVAKLCDADGVHVGWDDLSMDQIRSIAGATMLVGQSTRTPEQLNTALSQRPDYVAVGPMYPTQTKPQNHIAGLEYLREARAQTNLPIIAIGGISPENAQAVFEAGADVVAVCGAVISAPDPAAAASRILNLK